MDINSNVKSYQGRGTRAAAVALAYLLLALAPLPTVTASADESPPAVATIAGEATPAPLEGACPAMLTAPCVVTNDKINSGDTAWMLTSMALVLMMTIPGLALFYGGMVRKKNLLSTLMQSFAITCLVTVLWWLVGYSLAFTPANSAALTPYIGGLSRAFMSGAISLADPKTTTVSHLAPTIPEVVYSMFQLTFAIITPALICGSFAERMKFSAMLWFMGIWSLVVYAPIAHWVWEPSGWLAVHGQLDFAGGTVVHINAGIAGLATALMLGKRIGYGKETMAPHNVAFTVIGASLLWVGWFGFNAGSEVAADGRAGMAMTVTQIATAAAALAWMFAEWISKGKPSVLGIASGAVAGLVAITPASGFVLPNASVFIGVTAGVLCFFSATALKKVLGYDDSLDAFGVHCIGGIVGALLTGALVDKAYSGMDGTVLNQLVGVVATLGYGFVMSMFILWVLEKTIGIRVTADQEREGLDIALHGESVE
jgi:ammonium transporter, Amt family